MAIETRINRIATLLSQVKNCNSLVAGKEFQNSTKDDLQDYTKNILNEVKAEVDQIKTEVDSW